MRNGASVLVIAAATVVLLLGIAPAASATHDDYGADTVSLQDRPGALGRVEVVFPVDADHEESRAVVEEFAQSHGIELSDTRVEDNIGPDTVRVIARTALGERTGFLEYEVPAARLEPWGELFGDDAVYLSLPRWSQAEGASPRTGDDLAVTGQTVTYRISAWALGIPLLVLVAVVAGPYLGLRAFARRVESSQEAPADALHRIRRALIAVQVLVPLAIPGVLVATGTLRWPELLLTEIWPGADLPQPVVMVLTMAGFFVPLVAALLAATAAVLPIDRRLRETEQSTAAGLGQGLRGMALLLAPMALLLVFYLLVPGTGPWPIVLVAVVMAVVLAALGPVLMNSIMTTRAADEPLRQELLDLCSEHGLRVRDVRVLDTRGGKVANAGISGILPQLRYVFLTDHALEVLDEEETAAVLAHEIGHGKGHHLLIKLGAGLLLVGPLVALMLFAGDAWFASLVSVVHPIVLAMALPILLLTALLIVQGVVGVVLEKRADDYAARTVGAAPLASALEKLAEANAVKRRTGRLWNLLQQHPAIEQRLERLSEREPEDATQPS